MIALICAGALSVAGWVPIRENCRAPFDGALWTLEADADREQRIADLEAMASEAEADAAAMDVIVEDSAAALIEATAALAAARAELTEPLRAPILPGWTWTVGGLAAPWIGWLACERAGVDGSEWCAVGSGAVALGFAAAVTW